MWPYQSLLEVLSLLLAEFSPLVLAAAEAKVEGNGVGMFASRHGKCQCFRMAICGRKSRTKVQDLKIRVGERSSSDGVERGLKEGDGGKAKRAICERRSGQLIWVV